MKTNNQVGFELFCYFFPIEILSSFLVLGLNIWKYTSPIGTIIVHIFFL